MAKGGGGGAPAPPKDQVFLPEWRRIFDCLAAMLRQTNAQLQALVVERAHLQAELDFERCGRTESEDIFRLRIQKIYGGEAIRKRADKAEVAELLGKKELELRCYQKLAELTETDLEDFKSCISILAAENKELKIKLKEVESQIQLSENNVDHQHNAKDLKAELRKLKQAYKTLSSEKDKEISALRAEKSFVWNQFNTTDQEYRVTCKKKNIEVKQATELAKKLQQNLNELQVAAQNKDNEISRLQAEVINGKERMLILEDELQQMRSLVKAKDVETDKHRDEPETSQKCKRDINEASRKSKSEGPVLREKSRNSEGTPFRREVKTSRTRASSAKEMQSQSRNNSCMHNKEERGQSEASQKRKRGSSLSYGTRRCSTRLQVRTSASPMLFTPCFTIPKLSAARTPPNP